MKPNLTKIIAAILGIAGLSITITVNVAVRVDVRPPVPLDELGLAETHSQDAAPVAAEMPSFFVAGAFGQDNSRRNVRLWEFAKQANGGQHLPNYPQQTGDCVAFGTRSAAEYFTAAAVANGVIESDVKLVFPPHIYGGSRVTIGRGRLGRSAGSVGAWAAAWVRDYGVLPADTPGLPPYSGRLSDEWGVRGVPQKFVDASKEFLFRTVAPVRNARDVRDAVCNGYPVTIASDFGTRTIRAIDGRRVAIRDGRWMHQMVIVGYDGETGSRPYYYVLNSWGPNAHPAPLQGEPPGGFWITDADVEYIVRQNDSFAYSGFDGFPVQEFDLDFSVIGQMAAHTHDAMGETTMPTIWTEGIDPAMYGPGMAIGLLLMFAAGLLWTLGNGRRAAMTMVLLAAASVPIATVQAQEPMDLDFYSLMMPTANTAAFKSESAANDASNGYALDWSIIAAAATLSADEDEPRCDFSEIIRAASRETATPPAETPRPTHTGLDRYKGLFIWRDGSVKSTPQPGVNYPSVGVMAVADAVQTQPVTYWRCTPQGCYQVR